MPFVELSEQGLRRMHPQARQRYNLLKYIVRTACPGNFAGEHESRDAFETFQAFATKRCGYAYVTYLMNMVQYLRIFRVPNDAARQVTGFYFLSDGNIMLVDQPCHS